MTADHTTALDTFPMGSYRIDCQRSQVAYTGRHMFGLGAVHATFLISSGTFQIADPITASRVEVTVDAGSFRSNSAKRDRDVRSASLLDVATYPHIIFLSKDVHQDSNGWRVIGTVSTHGKEVPLEVVVDRAMPETGGMRMHGRAEHLDRYALGVTNAKGMVGRYLDLDLDVLAVPA